MTQTASRTASEDQYANYHAAYDYLKEKDAPLWVHQLRAQGFTRFLETGFPLTRELSFPLREDWLYTNVAPIARTAFMTGPEFASVTAGALEPYLFGATNWIQLVFINGRFDASLSRLPIFAAGVTIQPLADAMFEHGVSVQGHLGHSVDKSVSGFTALNTAFLQDGLFVHLADGRQMETPIHAVYVSTGGPAPIVSHPRTLIILGAGSSATVIESFVGLNQGVYLTNTVAEIVVGESANLDHYRVNRESQEAYHISTTEINQGRESSVSTFNMSTGGALVRNDTNARLNGERSVTRMNGLYLATGHQHVDNHTVIEHRQPNCDSYEVYKGILEDSAQAVFNGKVYVHREAQETNAKQLNKNLLLSPHASVHTKPQLEIHADQVKCTHGATVGQLDEEQIFYLRTRGLSRDAACHLLTYGFAGDLIRRLKLVPLREQLDTLFEETIQNLAMAQSQV